MRRKEEKFASAQVKQAASRLAPIVRSVRLSRNMTQEAAAERAKMSAFTWMKIERGDVSVSLGAWLSALECLGLLDALSLTAAPSGLAPAATTRLRARPSDRASEKYDF